MSDWRNTYQEIDYAGFISPSIDDVGQMVVNSIQGPSTPVLCQGEQDVLMYFGTPSSTYPEVFEAIAFTSEAPCWICSAIGSGAVWGGIDVYNSYASGFVSGRNYDTYTYIDNSISHSFFNASPAVDNLVADVAWVTGSQFTISLYKNSAANGNQLITSYDYSLIKEKDLSGKSLYINDVFYKNPYVIPMVNDNYSGGAYTVNSSTISFSGGSRGSTPGTSDYATAWANFQKVNKYPGKILMDCSGMAPITVSNLINTYNPYAFGITMVPYGNDTTDAIAYRQHLGLNTDKMAIYTNWQKIQDDYNNSFAWISGIGSIGKKYALMVDAYDAGSPAGVDESNHGGLIQDWTVKDIEYSYTDNDTLALDNAQINPFIKNEFYGLMLSGDRTAYSSMTDTSYIGTRRLYNYIAKNVIEQVMKLQDFKLNDSIHRLKARIMINDFLSPIKAASWIRDYAVVCDETNNTDIILQQRKFVVTIYIQVTPNSQRTVLQLVRVGQTQVISSFAAA